MNRPKRMSESLIVRGIYYLTKAEKLIEENALGAAAIALWLARDMFTQSKALEAPKYRKHAQERLDWVNAEIRKELAGNA